MTRERENEHGREHEYEHGRAELTPAEKFYLEKRAGPSLRAALTCAQGTSLLVTRFAVPLFDLRAFGSGSGSGL